MMPVSQPTFCSSCHLLENFISTFESLLASRQDLPAQYSRKITASLGRRSEIEERGQKCPGCRSLSGAFERYLKSGEDFDLEQQSVFIDTDYDVSLVIDASNVDVAWARPFKITALGLPVCASTKIQDVL